jgi:hypothetical protein
MATNAPLSDSNRVFGASLLLQKRDLRMRSGTSKSPLKVVCHLHRGQPMMNRQLPWLPCLAILLAGMLARTSAQAVLEEDTLEKKLQQSHLLDRFGLPGGGAEELFHQRLKAIRTKEIGEVLQKDNRATPEQLDLLRNRQDFIQEYLKKFKFDDLPEQMRKKFAGREGEIEKFIHSLKPEEFLNYAEAAQRLRSGSDATGPQPGGNPPLQPAPPTSETAPANGSGSSPESESRTQESDEANPGDPQANSVLGRWLLQAANRFKDLDPSVRNSPVLRKAIRELSQKIEGADDRWKELDKGANAIAEKWAGLGRAVPLDRLWPEKGFSWPRSLIPDSLPNWHFPETGPRPGSGATFTVPRSGMPDLSERDGWRGLWMLAILLALGLVLWKALGRTPAGSRGDGAGAWKLGPWPVHPTAVQTRDELIRAFEYLSVLHLGPAARHWHHLAIASGLGQLSSQVVSAGGRSGDSAERQRAADQLASLYEQARYAPPTEPLLEAALTTARRDLCLLAGVPVS